MANSKRKCKYHNVSIRDYVVVNNMAFCSYEFANKYYFEGKSKEYNNKKKLQKKKDVVRKEALKTSGDYIKEAQASINKYVRIRDKNKPCISCSNNREHKIGLSGHRYDAGHYRSRGSAGHLRFNLFNIHKQCVKCNRENSGNVVEYRLELINRIGQDRVDKLETDNDPRKFTIEYLKRVKSIFNKKARLYERKFR